MKLVGQPILLRISKELRESLEQLADRYDLPLSIVARKALAIGVNNFCVEVGKKKRNKT
jgi:predicted transcriptional regulator